MDGMHRARAAVVVVCRQGTYAVIYAEEDVCNAPQIDIHVYIDSSLEYMKIAVLRGSLLFLTDGDGNDGFSCYSNKVEQGLWVRYYERN
jgi:hypothetical protein